VQRTLQRRASRQDFPHMDSEFHDFSEQLLPARL
jgi:hypothetical protein